MIKIQLSFAAAFAAFSIINAEKAPGDIIQLKMRTVGKTDQIRILTKPRAGYDPATDTPSVWNMMNNDCEDVSSVDFILDPVDDESKCCRLPTLDGFNLWPEKQDYTIPSGSNVVVQDKFPLNNGCFERSTDPDESYTLEEGETFNSYMAQTFTLSNDAKYYDNLVEFHNQDIVAIISTTDKLSDTDQYFALGGPSTYNSVRNSNSKWRGFESNGYESYSVNCRASCHDASSKGDPHFTTFVGEHFEYHGQCDLVLAKDPNFAEGLGFDIQIRTKLVRYWSYIKRAALRIGDDILEVEGSSGALGETNPVYWFNFDFQKQVEAVGGFPLKITKGIGRSHKHVFEVDLSSKYPGQKIVIATMKEFVKVDFVNVSAEAFGKTVGILGDFNSGKTYARDQVTVIDDFIELGNEWQVLPSDNMLFHDVSDPQFPKRCILPEDPRGERRRRLAESSISIEEAEAACSKGLKNPMDIKDCVYDILATQDLDMVGAF